MNLWLRIPVLVVGFCLSSSAPTSEECGPLVEPLSLDDRSVMFGSWNFISGYTDCEMYNNLLKTTQSSRMQINAGHDANQIQMVQENKMNGTCFGSTSNATIEGNLVKASINYTTSLFHILPTCDDCLLFSINSTTKNINKLLETLKYDVRVGEDEVAARAIYLMSKESTVKDSDLEQFKKQASCLGFSGEPDFIYDPADGFCEADEVVQMMFR